MPATITNRQLLQSGTPLVAAVLLLGLCLAAGAAMWWQHVIDRDAETEFKRSVERVVADVALRLGRPVYGLNGARGVYATHKHVQRAAFLAYVESRDLPKEFPGVRGFGFIQRVMRPDLDAFVADEKTDGARGFAIRHLADKSHDDLYVIKFIEPAANNAGAQGLDIGSEANRRTAVQRAIDTGDATITRAITLVQQPYGNTPGVLLFVPVYANGAHPSTADERRASLVGLLYAPIVIAELLDGMAGIVIDDVDFHLFDAASGGTLLYDTDHHLANPASAQTAQKGGALFDHQPRTAIRRRSDPAGEKFGRV
jgi:CHASE1-domain containing sensor protein